MKSSSFVGDEASHLPHADAGNERAVYVGNRLLLTRRIERGFWSQGQAR
jgi:hypothetical protein